MSRAWFWRTLGIAKTGDTGAIRRAYAERLKALDIDREAETYAELREARDAALAWARQQPAEAEVAPPSEPEGSPDSPVADGWPYHAPLLDCAEGDAALRIAAPPELHPGLRPLSPPRAQSGELRDIAPCAAAAFAMPLAAAGADLPDDRLVQPEGRYDAALHDLLYANGEDDPTPLTEEEAASALRWQRLVLRDAAQGDLTAHDAIETWLAERLAGAWPRSAPLLGEASDAFGWDREAGRLGERPAQVFLNARLKGMRFLERVQLLSHELHAAWVELNRPGRSNWLGRQRQSRSDVEQLLSGIRKHFPELESYLDPQRVASWESVESTPRSPWVVWIILVGVIQIVAALGRCSGPPDHTNAFDYKPTSYEAPAEVERAKLDQAARELFGDDTSYLDVARYESELADTIRANLVIQANDTDGQGLRRAASIVRERSYIAAQLGDSAADLRAAMGLRLGQLKAARSKDAASCKRLLHQNLLDPDVVLPDDLRQRERRFAHDLLLAGKLEPSPRTPRDARQATIPGPTIGRMMRDTGFGEAKVRRILHNEDGLGDGDICSGKIALLTAALDLGGKTGDAILRTL